MEISHIIIAFSILLTCGLEGAKLPTKPASAYFKICHRSDPDINNCIKTTIEDLKPRLIKGIPELEIVPVDPLNIPRLEFKEGSGNFEFRQTVTNLTIYGLKDFIVADAKINFNNFELVTTLKTPTLLMVGKYDMEGKILVLPVKGNGDCSLNFTDVTAIATAKGEKVMREGKEHLQLKSLDWDINVGHAHVYFSNLFNGDKALGETTNNFLNENWRDAFTTYKHLAQEAFGILFKDMANKVYQKFPYEELFPQ